MNEATIQYIKEHRNDDVRTLALQGNKSPDIDMPMALTQIEGWQIARFKLPSWADTDNILYPPHLSMEQCSSEQTAKYKASLLKGNSFVDLTGGLGVDFSFIARHFKQATYIEQQPSLVELAKYNLNVLGLSNKIVILHADGVEYLRQIHHVDAIYLDPARRDEHGGKVIVIAECEPDITQIENTLIEKADKVLVKLSPMLDIIQTMRELKHISSVHIVAINNECKELLLTLEKDSVLNREEIPIHCVNFRIKESQQFEFSIKEEQHTTCMFAEEIGQYLYEPNASVMKSGAYKLLTKRYNVQKLAPDSHLYTSHSYNPDFPGRRFCVQGVSGFKKNELHKLLDNVRQANLTIRNYPASVAELRKKLKLKEGGEHFLFATTLLNGKKVLIKTKNISLQ
ncbi:MAG: THUMP-like domain-containing protein [Phocaeicola sp.]|uniref:class I SAM-dependent methyltransferase n=1 Tax=Phocaeicola sp. TaxID=2773926 RepID=UPI003FA17956